VSIHPLAVVSPEAKLGVGVKVGAFAIVEPDVELGDFCSVASGAVIKSGVAAGCHNEFGEHSVIGGAPQHAARPQTIGRLVIGDHNVFREYVTVHRALKVGMNTTIGDMNFVMASAHVGHDVAIGNNVILAATWSWRTGRSCRGPSPSISSAGSDGSPWSADTPASSRTFLRTC
jgi:UDP-N-acetylglucosamine acyltransferase